MWVLFTTDELLVELKYEQSRMRENRSTCAAAKRIYANRNWIIREIIEELCIRL